MVLPNVVDVWVRERDILGIKSKDLGLWIEDRGIFMNNTYLYDILLDIFALEIEEIYQMHYRYSFCVKLDEIKICL